MGTDSLIGALIIGALAGWLAGKIMKGDGIGVISDQQWCSRLFYMHIILR